ncbi:MAG: F0F1 ATP synthase subunit C [Candidatus Bipolaricaulota bacterium]|nr:F0F1 ATP synthase subunit C [Candidatus Bipolaricaulota bacterium]
MKKLAIAVLVFNVVVVGACLVGLAQELPQFQSDALAGALKSFAAALAFVGGALATAIAQSRIGPAAVAAVAENRENFVSALIFVAIPETLVVFGFVVVFLL